MELVDFLRARLDEDERIAEEAGGRRAEWRLARPLDDAELGDASWLRPPELKHAERHDPARVLAEVEAKRAVVDLYAAVAEMDREDSEPEYAYGRAAGLGEAARRLAHPFHAHPDFDPAWLED